MAAPVVVHNVPADHINQQINLYLALGKTKITIQQQADGTYTLTAE